MSIRLKQFISPNGTGTTPKKFPKGFHTDTLVAICSREAKDLG